MGATTSSILRMGQDFASMYGNPSATGEWNPEVGVYSGPSNDYSTMMNWAIQPSFVDKWGRSAPSTNWDDYVVIPGTSANSGHDNKYDAFNSWMDAGAFYDPSKDVFNRQYWVPKNFTPMPTAANPNPTAAPNTATGISLYDENPTLVDEWGLIPILAPLVLGAMTGGALGLFGAGTGAGVAGEAAALGAGGEAIAGGSTLADLYGASTGMSVASAPGAATGSALYGASTGADLAAALGSTSWADMFAQPGSMSVDPNLSSWSQIYGDLTGQSVAPDWLSTLPNTFNTSPLYTAATTPLSLLDKAKDFLKDNSGSIAKNALSLFQQPEGQAMSAVPDFGSSVSGGTQPQQQQPISQQQQQGQQLSVPQFNQMQSPQQGAENYQAPMFQDIGNSWGQPSIFQLSQSTWNPAMANALRSHNA